MRKIIIRIVIVLASIIVLIGAIVGGYFAYVGATYYRIEDNLTIEPVNNSTSKVEKNTEYSILTYNIGFGAYSQDYSFFMDSGEMLDGTKVSGKYGKGKNKEETLKNTNGSIDILKAKACDFMLIQECDQSGSRSYNVNQQQMICDTFSSYSYSYAINYHCAFIALPLNDPMGTAVSGLLSLSRFEMASSLRKQLPISTAFIAKNTDLDRAINLVRYTVGDKELLIINVHLSAYDKGGVIRKQQIELLNTILEEEKNKGNYVIVGGDTNHDIANSLGKFPTTQKDPSWVSVLTEDDLVDGYSFAADGETWGSCRAAEMPYVKGENYVVTVDGYIVSDNIKVNSVENYDNDFLYSDHLPAIMKFELL